LSVKRFKPGGLDGKSDGQHWHDGARKRGNSIVVASEMYGSPPIASRSVGHGAEVNMEDGLLRVCLDRFDLHHTLIRPSEPHFEGQ
jgi:hypothetical protein